MTPSGSTADRMGTAGILRPLDLPGKTDRWMGSSRQLNFRSRAELSILPPATISATCRLNFDWLSASNNAVEVNTHPASSPVCGWVLPNHWWPAHHDQSGASGRFAKPTSRDEKVHWIPARELGHTRNKSATRTWKTFVDGF